MNQTPETSAGAPATPEPSTAHVLVLGGSSFVGGRLTRALLAGGADVTILNRGLTGTAPDGVRRLVADRRDLGSMKKALDTREWDVVYDMSGYVMATDADNFAGLVDLLDGMVGRYVFVSSIMAYRPTGIFPWTEDAAVRDEPPTTYGGFKVFAEGLVLERLSGTVVRPAAIYGPTNNILDMEAAMFLRLRRGLPILLPHGGLVATSYGHVDDLADGMLRLAADRRAAGTVVNLTGEGVTAAEYVRTLAEIVGAEPDIVPVPDEVVTGLDRPAFCRLFTARHHGIASTERARREFGLAAERGFRAGHAETYDWFLASPLAEAKAESDPLWGKGFDLAYEAEVAGRLRR